jgi:threonine/homoserine/homoserine lactone efflux protein
MPSLDALLVFAAFSLALVIVPGPSVLFVISRAVTVGRRGALYTVLGNAGGVYVQVVLVAVGLGALVERSVAAFTVIKLAGAAYLIWLGLQALRHRSGVGFETAAASEAIPTPTRSLLLDGFLVGVANPKSIVFFAAVLPQFVASSGTPAGIQMAVLGLVFVVIAVISDSAWGLAAGTARNWLTRSPKQLARLNGLGGLVMIGLGLRLAATGRAD